MKKLFTTFLIILSLAVMQSTAVFADSITDALADVVKKGSTAATAGTGSNETYSLKEATFNVSENLVLDNPDPEQGAEQGQNYFKDNSNTPLFSFILSVLNFATRIIGTIAVLLLIVSGFILMTSQGNDQRLETGKNMIKYTVIGLAVTFMSYIVILFVQSIFTN